MNFHFKAADNIRLLADDMMLLVREEVQLARQELELKMNQATNGLLLGIAGILAAFVALGVLVYAAIAGLATQMPLWAAAASVGAVFALLALILLVAARRRLKPGNLTPHRAISSVSRTAHSIKETIG
ncbi:MAG: phage holin family protein [Anderseniella sp.]|jgi:membrane protein|nr:phage holin family protein [Anderseniella sp.]